MCCSPDPCIFSLFCLHLPLIRALITCRQSTQVTDLLLCWSLIRNWCSLKCSYFVEGFACWCYLGMWQQIPFILLVGQLCHQRCKLCSPLCNHSVAIHIQKQTDKMFFVTVCRDISIFISRMEWEVVNVLYLSLLLIILNFMHSLENSSRTALCFYSDSFLGLISFHKGSLATIGK